MKNDLACEECRNLPDAATHPPCPEKQANGDFCYRPKGHKGPCGYDTPLKLTPIYTHYRKLNPDEQIQSGDFSGWGKKHTPMQNSWLTIPAGNANQPVFRWMESFVDAPPSPVVCDGTIVERKVKRNGAG